MGPAEAVVWAADVAFDYRRRRALDGVGFAVAAGSLFGFLGPNGSGKSTLFRLLATLLPPQRGRLVVAGHDVARQPRQAREALGVAFQSPSLDLRLTVEENLRTHGHLYGLSGRALAERIDQNLERFGLADRRRERAESLSGGLRRRVELAKALLHRPRVLLLDEPSTGLDPRARRELRSVLEELAAGGVTVLLTTHFIDEAEACHRLLLLDRGHVVAEGTPAELTAEVGGEVITLAVGSGTTAAGELAAEVEAALGDPGGNLRPEVSSVGGGAGNATAVRLELPAGAPGTRGADPLERQATGSGPGARASADSPSPAAAWDLVARLARRLPRWDERVSSVTVARPTLEDVFLHRTGRRLDEAPQELAAAHVTALDAVDGDRGASQGNGDEAGAAGSGGGA